MKRITLICDEDLGVQRVEHHFSDHSVRTALSVTAAGLGYSGKTFEHDGLLVGPDGFGYTMLGDAVERCFEDAWAAAVAWMNTHAYKD